MNLYKSGYIQYSSSLSQSVFNASSSLSYSKTYSETALFNTALNYDGTTYTAITGILSFDTKNTSERDVLSPTVSYNITGSTVNFRSKTLPDGVTNSIKLISYNGNLSSDSAYSIISTSNSGVVVGEITLDDYYNYTTGSDNYQSGSLQDSGSFTLTLSSSAINRYGYTNLIAYTDHLYQQVDINDKEDRIDYINTSILSDPSTFSAFNRVDISSNGTYIASADVKVLVFKATGEGSDRTYTKLSSPSTFPNVNTVRHTKFSPNVNYLCVSVDGNLTGANINKAFMYYRSGDSFIKLNSPVSNNFNYDVRYCVWSHDENYLARLNDSGADGNIQFYYKSGTGSGTTFTRLTFPTTLPGGRPVLGEFIDGSNYFVMSTDTNLVTYSASDSGVNRTYTLLGSPSTKPSTTSAYNGISKTTDENYIAITSATTPYLFIYKHNGDGTLTKLNNPSSTVTVSNTFAFLHNTNTLVRKLSSKLQVFNIIDDVVQDPLIYDLGLVNAINYAMAIDSSSTYGVIGGGGVITTSSAWELIYLPHITNNFTQTIISHSDINSLSLNPSALPQHTFKKLIEPDYKGTIQFTSSLSESVYNASGSSYYSRSYDIFESGMEISQSKYINRTGFVSFDVPQYKTGNSTVTASLNFTFNDNASVFRSNVLPTDVENKLYITSYTGSITGDAEYSIISSSYQLPTESIIGTIDLDNYFAYTTQSGVNIVSSSKLGNYTASIVIPSESIQYGETNNYLVYSDFFKKKEDFVNQVEGYNPINMAISTGYINYNESTYPLGVSSVNDYFALQFAATPYMYIYRNNYNNTFTRMNNPSSVPALTSGNNRGIDISSDGTYIVTKDDTTSKFSVFKRNVNTITRLANPDTLPPQASKGISITSDAEYIAVNATNTSPYFYIYNMNSDVMTKLNDANIDQFPNGYVLNLKFSLDGNFLAVQHRTSPYLSIYSGSGDGLSRTFTKLDDPNTLYVQFDHNRLSLDFSNDGSRLLLGFQTLYYDNILNKYNNLVYNNTMYGHNQATISGDGNFVCTYGGTAGVYPISYDIDANTNSYVRIDDPSTILGSDVSYMALPPNDKYLVVTRVSSPYAQLYDLTNMTSNKTSLRLNPDIKLELDVNYPLGKIGSVGETPMSNTKRVNNKQINDIDNISGIDKT